MIETHLLYYFLAVANTGGFTRAAEYPEKLLETKNSRPPSQVNAD